MLQHRSRSPPWQEPRPLRRPFVVDGMSRQRRRSQRGRPPRAAKRSVQECFAAQNRILRGGTEVPNHGMGRAQRGMFGVLVIALGLVLLPHLNAELVVTFDPVAGETHQLERWKTPKLRRADGLPGAT